jgi:hypothetical protein
MGTKRMSALGRTLLAVSTKVSTSSWGSMPRKRSSWAVIRSWKKRPTGLLDVTSNIRSSIGAEVSAAVLSPSPAASVVSPAEPTSSSPPTEIVMSSASGVGMRKKRKNTRLRKR